MATSRCQSCNSRLAPDAKFCNRCGEPVGASGSSRRCEDCGAALPAGARFCTACGHERGDSSELAPDVDRHDSLVPAAEEFAEDLDGESVAMAPEEDSLPLAHLPPRRLPRGVSGASAPKSSGMPTGSLLADVGAAVSIIGCFLPLASGMGEHVSLIPSVTREFSHAYVVPVSAILIAIMAWAGATGSKRNRLLNGGGVIAVSSPWTAMFLLALLATVRAQGFFGWLNLGDNIGPGAIALPLGFALSLLGGFLILTATAGHQT